MVLNRHWMRNNCKFGPGSLCSEPRRLLGHPGPLITVGLFPAEHRHPGTGGRSGGRWPDRGSWNVLHLPLRQLLLPQRVQPGVDERCVGDPGSGALYLIWWLFNVSYGPCFRLAECLMTPNVSSSPPSRLQRRSSLTTSPSVTSVAVWSSQVSHSLPLNVTVHIIVSSHSMSSLLNQSLSTYLCPSFYV